ncbi:MAG: hypothetical protein COA42_04930, partial [Alteromonadaceae bacterium]
MPTPKAKKQLSYRDGTSQGDRSKPALKPEYAPIDERKAKDLLNFIARFAGELRYFDEHNTSENADGSVNTWVNFFKPLSESAALSDDDLDSYLDQIVDYMNDPNSVSPQMQANFSRPHFTLLLSFVKLLGHGKDHLNTLTGRHINFYYEQLLKFERRAPVNDRANLLVELVKSADFYELEEGRELAAGKDSDGNQLIYRTDRRVEINKACVSQLISIYSDKQALGVREYRQQNIAQKGKGIKQQQDALVSMLSIVLGRPLPGDELPLFPTAVNTDVSADNQDAEFVPVTYALVQKQKQNQKQNNLVDFTLLQKFGDIFTFIGHKTPEGLHLNFTQLHELMRFKWRREPTEFDPEYTSNKSGLDSDWRNIHRVLSLAAAKAGGSIDALAKTLEVAAIKDFYGNFQKAFQSALGFDPYASESFDGLSGVSHIDHVFRDRHASAVKAFIENTEKNPLSPRTLHLTMADFEQMMQIKQRVEGEWRYINEIILKAAASKNARLKNASISDAGMANFNNNIKKYLGNKYPKIEGINSIGNMDQLYAGLLPLEYYFALPLSDIAFTISTVQKANIDEIDWRQIEGILNESGREKNARALRARWLQTLEQKYATLLTDETVNDEQRWIQIIADVMDEEAVTTTGSDAVNSLAPYLSVRDNMTLTGLYGDENNAKADATKLKSALALIANAAQQKYRDDSPLKQEIWNNLYFNNDAPSTVVKTSLGADSSTTRWRTFGDAPALVAEDANPPGEIGWLLSAPILNLSQGQRRITLDLVFEPTGFSLDKIKALFNSEHYALRALVSTEKDWIGPAADNFKVSVKINKVRADGAAPGAPADQLQPVMTLSLDFAEDIDPICRPSQDVHGISCESAAIKLMLRQNWSSEGATGLGQFKTDYPTFKSLLLASADVQVKVTGLCDLQLQNDQRVLKSGKPFEPFGARPDVGSNFYFAHPELAGKQFTEMALNCEWMGLPTNVVDHYKNYIGAKSLSEANFSVDVDIYQQGRKGPYSSTKKTLGSKALFGNRSTEGKSILSSIQLNDKDLGIFVASGDYSAGRSVTEGSHYLQLSLNNQDFQHNNYSISVTKNSADLALAMGGANRPTNTDAYIVNPPYTPKIKNLSIDYSASLHLDLRKTDLQHKQADATAIVRHVQPYGYSLADGPESI